jgi:hypothetical protein
LYAPSSRKVSGTLIVRTVPPAAIAANIHMSPLRRAKIESSPMRESGRTMVSSQTGGMPLITSAAGLSSTLCGWAATVRIGLLNVARLAIWCAQVESARR